MTQASIIAISGLALSIGILIGRFSPDGFSASVWAVGLTAAVISFDYLTKRHERESA